MVHVELDSFYVKFKHLLRAEKDATLTLKSEAGRAFVTLSLDLGHVLSEQDLRPRGGSRNGPARVRRREKRAAARFSRLRILAGPFLGPHGWRSCSEKT